MIKHVVWKKYKMDIRKILIQREEFLNYDVLILTIKKFQVKDILQENRLSPLSHIIITNGN